MSNPTQTNRLSHRAPRGHLSTPPPGLSEEDYRQWWASEIRRLAVIDENGCWIWPGTVDNRGYGRKAYRGRKGLAPVHRQYYKIIHGIELRRDQFLCHKCDVPRCCNPDHLWIGNNSENQRDAGLKGRHQESKKTHCPAGHPYNEQNTRIRLQSRGYGFYRYCIVCAKARDDARHRSPEGKAKARERTRRYKARLKAEKAQVML